jgi:leader peptidase (prepilin peptidase) / N-methyltransferase
MLALEILYVVFGLIIGSFLNVCIHRIPRGESIVFPGSHCPRCGKAVRPSDNVPVLAYLWLRGRCRDCGERISPQYPAVELLTGTVFFGCVSKWGLTPPTFVNSLFLSMVIVLGIIDYHHRLLPNVITLPGWIIGLALAPFQNLEFYDEPLTRLLASMLLPDRTDTALPWVAAAVGSVLGGGLLLGVALAYEKIRHKQGLGMGDVKMMAMVGAFLGWRLVLLTIFAGSVLGSAIGLFIVLFRGGNLQTKLSFGTFLALGAIISVFFGIRILAWYSGAY